MRGASTEIQGENLFGRVTSGKVVVTAEIIVAHWISDRRGWLSSSRPCVMSGCAMCDDTTFILDRNGEPIYCWQYDDAVHGVFPGPPLTDATPINEVESRRISEAPDQPTRAWDTSLFREKAIYVPETLLLVKGPARYKIESATHEGRRTLNLE